MADAAWPGRLASGRERKRSARSDRLGSDIDPDRPVGSLRIGERQVVEIARALSGNARCLILDEPTAALSAGESDRLFEIIRRLRTAGVAIIYITHRLDEVQQIADRVQVLRDGATVLEGAVADHDRDAHGGGDGRSSRRFDAASRRQRLGHRTSTPVIRLRDLVVGARRSPTSTSSCAPARSSPCTARVGAGTQEVAEAIYGVRDADSGTIEMGGQAVADERPGERHPRRASDSLPGDRQREGAFMNRPVAENLCVASWPTLSAARRHHRQARGGGLPTLARPPAHPLAQRSAPVDGDAVGWQPAEGAARPLAASATSRCSLLVEPTRGVDVGAREEIYRAIRALTERGLAVLVATSDHEEVVQLADRALVMVRGRIVRELSGDQITAEEIVAAAGGLP